MSIMTRMLRLWKADIHGVMDELEDKGLLLKQYMRDMEEELDRKEARRKQLDSSLQKCRRDLDHHSREIEKLESDLSVSIEKGKDDIARFLIRKLKLLQDHKTSLESHSDTLNQELKTLSECISEQRRQYEEIRLKSSEYDRKLERDEWEKASSAIPTGCVKSDISDEEIELELLRRKDRTERGTSL